ncbi:sigma-70 family RNA polymerase sigma factor [Ramlibacter sp.]|uniref:sigma-70 family RNA polymerase sigma factor n=1 Tax=Ramlibacter sp. TaxID=1917967 RepID=UPI0017C36A76|nr:sigma-70 family RNA polymerase sigma factor [Ramlibacter sp.]MBA2675443.1 sigma-70 family RNA polymerase sigma factor [Ramlibacter sp.]
MEAVPFAQAQDRPPPGGAAPERALWLRWRGTRDELARTGLLELHLPYARTVAATYYGKRFHNEIEFDEYLQLARLGLIEAMERFDPDAGAQFRTFAARRMHGAILDGLERTTEKQQQIAVRQRLLAERQESLKNADGNAPGSGRGTPQQVLQYVAEAGLAFALAWMLDGTGMVETPERVRDLPFYRSVELRELRERLLELVHALPAQERRVIHAHYLQEQPFDQIAVLLGLSKGRISQLHRGALRHLRESMRSPPACDLFL